MDINNIKIFINNIAKCNMHIIENSMKIKEKKGVLRINGKAVSDKDEIIEFRVKIKQNALKHQQRCMYQMNFVVQIFDEENKKIADLIGVDTKDEANLLIANLQPHIAYKLSILDLRRWEYTND